MAMFLQFLWKHIKNMAFTWPLHINGSISFNDSESK